jgi:two-component system nitrate/nitrite sensor histidine kinase NarX
LSPDSKHIHLFVHEGLARSAANDGHCIAGGECACCEAAQSQSPIVRRLQPVQPLHTTCERGDYRTIAAFTIQAQNKLLGIFNLYFRDEHLLDAPEQQLFETLGRHLGTALENQRLVARDKELAVSDERNLLAQELHDSIAQSLAFLNIQAQLLQEALRAGQTQQATESVKQIREGIQESYDDVRELLVHFRTRVDHADIEQALRTTLEKFEGQTGIKTSFEQSGLGIALSPEQELQALHIVQEALSNVRKHARASAVALSLRRGPEYAFCIRDNGAGFDPQATIGPADSHVGLKIMRERAHRIGGSLAIKSAPGHGTEVTLTLPVAQREAA